MLADFWTAAVLAPVEIAWRWAPYIVVLLVVGVLVAAGFWLLDGGWRVHDAEQQAQAMDVGRCGCEWARRGDSHLVDEHTACRDGLCGRCDSCKSELLIEARRRRMQGGGWR